MRARDCSVGACGYTVRILCPSLRENSSFHPLRPVAHAAAGTSARPFYSHEVLRTGSKLCRLADFGLARISRPRHLFRQIPQRFWQIRQTFARLPQGNSTELPLADLPEQLTRAKDSCKPSSVGITVLARAFSAIRCESKFQSWRLEWPLREIPPGALALPPSALQGREEGAVVDEEVPRVKGDLAPRVEQGRVDGIELDEV